MTRINCIPVEELHDKHLLAEYRELPRVFSLARGDADIPDTYRMGKGHVTFFYDKRKRGWKPKHCTTGLVFLAPAELYKDWTPTEEAMKINRERIAERLEAMGDNK